MQCIICGSYFKASPFNRGPECDDCVDQIEYEIESFERAYEADVLEITNPTGKTKPVFLDD